jgi:tetratricopeptide (TPR) repeat protein
MNENTDRPQSHRPTEVQTDPLTLVGPGEPDQPARTLVGPGDVTLGSESDADGSGILIDGTVVNDRYEVLGILGRGGMGCVYRVRDRKAQGLNNWELHRALKIVTGDSKTLDRVQREVAAGDLAHHQNLVRTTDWGFADPTKRRFYIVMDLIGGGTLLDLIKASPGKFAPERARRLIEGILYGLQALHQRGVVHRDLKPSNVLIDNSRDEMPCLADFGIAHETGYQHTSLRGSGSANYAAPEQTTGNASLASDIFAFGRVAFELLVGHLPKYGDPHLHRLRSDVPRAACQFFMDCMEEDQAKRPSSATEALERLQRDWPRHAVMESPGSHTEAAMERLLTSGKPEQALENAAIARETMRTSARIEWLSAKALHSLDRVRESYKAYRDALAMGPEPRGRFAFDFATLLRQIGRFEEAADELDSVIDDEADSGIRHMYIQVLHECHRTEEAARWAAEHMVVPTVPQVAQEAAVIALELGHNDFVVSCAAVADPKAEDGGDLAAAAGLAYLALGDSTAALPRLERGRDSLQFGGRVKLALWDALNRLGRHSDAVDLLSSINHAEEDLIFRHVEACLKSFVSNDDGFRIAAILQRTERLPSNPDLLADAACVLERRCLPGPELKLLTRTLTDLNWGIFNPGGGPNDAPKLEFDPKFQRDKLPSALRSVADLLFSQLLKRLQEQVNAGETIGQLANELILRGFDSPRLRELRFDRAPNFHTMPSDAEFLRRAGLFTDGRRTRLLECAQSCEPQARSVAAVRACIEFDPHWIGAVHALLHEMRRTGRSAIEPIELSVIAQYASQPARKRPDGMTLLAVDALAAWMRSQQDSAWPIALGAAMRQLADRQREIPVDSVPGAKLEGFDCVGLVRNCLHTPPAPNHMQMARQIALSTEALDAMDTPSEDRLEILKLVAANPASDLDGLATTRLITLQVKADRLQSLTPWLTRRLAGGGVGGAIASTTAAVLASCRGDYHDALRCAREGEQHGDFRLATLLALGMALRGQRQPHEAIHALDAAEDCLQDERAVRTARLLGLEPTGIITRERAEARKRAGLFKQAADDMHRVPAANRDTRWALETAENLFNVRSDEGHAAALEFCRQQLRTPLRSMQLIRMRFEKDHLLSNAASMIADAAALALSRYPWLKPHAAPDMPPIGAPAATLNTGHASVDGAEGNEAETLAWAAIGRVLVHFIIQDSTSAEHALTRLEGLKPIAPTAEFAAATQRVSDAARLERRLAVHRATTRRPIATDLEILNQLAAEPCLRQALQAHAIWIARETLARTWRRTAFASRSGELLRILASTSIAQGLTHQTLARLEAVSGRPDLARSRLTTAFIRNEISQDEFRATLIGIGFIPTDSPWIFGDRIRFLIQSPHRIARITRVALGVAWFFTAASFVFRERLYVYPGIFGLGATVLLAASLTWPVERAMGLRSGFRLVIEEQHTQAAISFVLCMLALTIIAVGLVCAL